MKSEPLIISTDAIRFLSERTEFIVIFPFASVTETCNGSVTEFRFTCTGTLLGFETRFSFRDCPFWLPFKAIKNAVILLVAMTW